MHIEKIILSALIFWVSLPVLAEECPENEPLVLAEGRSCIDGWDKNGNFTGECGYHKLCVDCEYSDEVHTTKENCDLCPNRKYVDEKCILK